MAMGRPTLYTPDLLEKAREYVDGGWMVKDAYPQIASMATYIGITRKTVWEWCGHDDKEDFCNIVEYLMQKQESELLNNGIRGDFNSTITKLALTKHNYSDKSETTLQGGDKPIAFAPWTITGVGAE
jgi:hypothetical protein